ncbi:hypothetical protein SLS62_004303 [Diatrype stigma]|uniref:Uncharacterized protein n=1 Tax=Diatrype stigma TaxID=117547 RepID=A0AAN9YQL5_9PEZI
MSRHLTIATGATALFALAGRGLAFSSRSDGIVIGGPTPTPTPASTAKFALLHSHIQAATEPTITGPPKFSKAKDNDEDEGDDEDENGEDDLEEEGETGVCKRANQLVNHCASAIPNINSAPEDEIAQCLCCDGDGDFKPDYFDDAAASCAGWIKTAVPESTGAYNAWSTLGNLCGGNSGLGSSVCSWSKTPATATGSLTAAVVNTNAAASKTTPGAILITSAAAAVVPNACESLGSIGAYCQEETSAFDDLPLRSQAECLCYISTESAHATTWVPDTFDGAYSSCAGAGAAISLNPGYDGICSRYGDFLTAGSVSATTTTTAEDSSSSAISVASIASTASSTTASQTAFGSATAVTVTVAPSAEPSTGAAAAAAAGLNSLPASWPVAIGAMLGAAILLL